MGREWTGVHRFVVYRRLDELLRFINSVHFFPIGEGKSYQIGKFR